MTHSPIADDVVHVRAHVACNCCGYDLVGRPLRSRCPECGTPVERAREPATFAFTIVRAAIGMSGFAVLATLALAALHALGQRRAAAGQTIDVPAWLLFTGLFLVPAAAGCLLAARIKRRPRRRLVIASLVYASLYLASSVVPRATLVASVPLLEPVLVLSVLLLVFAALSRGPGPAGVSGAPEAIRGRSGARTREHDREYPLADGRPTRCARTLAATSRRRPDRPPRAPCKPPRGARADRRMARRTRRQRPLPVEPVAALDSHAGPRRRAPAGARRRGERARARRWLVRGSLFAAAGAAVFFVGVEHRLLRSAPGGDGLTIVHWNLTPEDPRAPGPAPGDRVLELSGDVTILVDAHTSPGISELLASLPEDVTPVFVGRFMVLTRVPVLEARPIVSLRHKTRHDKKALKHPNRPRRTFSSDVVLLRFDCRETLGRELTVYAVDLPSYPLIPRGSSAAKARARLDEADVPAPDLVVGDFNNARGSAAMRRLFPGLRHAYDEAGHGYGASFHRQFPLYHIDHVLLGEGVRCTRYDLLDPGIGRHLVQRAVIALQSDAGQR